MSLTRDKAASVQWLPATALSIRANRSCDPTRSQRHRRKGLGLGGRDFVVDRAVQRRAAGHPEPDVPPEREQPAGVSAQRSARRVAQGFGDLAAAHGPQLGPTAADVVDRQQPLDHPHGVHPRQRTDSVDVRDRRVVVQVPRQGSIHEPDVGKRSRADPHVQVDPPAHVHVEPPSPAQAVPRQQHVRRRCARSRCRPTAGPASVRG